MPRRLRVALELCGFRGVLEALDFLGMGEPAVFCGTATGARALEQQAPSCILHMSVTERMVGTFRDKAALEPSRARILIVEDESFVAVDDQLTLEGVGFETIGVVATAEEAIEVAERERPDLVLMDVHLAGPLNGIDAAVRIFERCSIHAVFATAHVDDQTKALANRAHPVGWLTKPFSSNDLVRAVELGLEKTKQ